VPPLNKIGASGLQRDRLFNDVLNPARGLATHVDKMKCARGDRQDDTRAHKSVDYIHNRRPDILVDGKAGRRDAVRDGSCGIVGPTAGTARAGRRP
jgi:hypothetical protein